MLCEKKNRNEREEMPQPFSISVSLILLGAFAGTLGTIAWKYIDGRMERRRESKNLMAAFYGEISSIVEIISGLDLVNDVELALKNLAASGTPRNLDLSVKQDYFGVYKNNLNRLGLLESDLAKNICVFYTYGLAVIEYLNDLSTDKWAQATTATEAEEAIRRLLILLKIHKMEGIKVLLRLEQ